MGTPKDDHSREYLIAEIRRLEQLIEHQREISDERYVFHKNEHVAMDKAVDVAKSATELRLHSMNELREQVVHERSLYLLREVFETTTIEWGKWRELINLGLTEKITKTEYDREHKTLASRVGLLESQAANYQGRLWALGVAISGVVVLVNLAIKFWK